MDNYFGLFSLPSMLYDVPSFTPPLPIISDPALNLIRALNPSSLYCYSLRLLLKIPPRLRLRHRCVNILSLITLGFLAEINFRFKLQPSPLI